MLKIRLRKQRSEVLTSWICSTACLEMIVFVFSISVWIQESYCLALPAVSGPLNQIKVIGDLVIINCSTDVYMQRTPDAFTLSTADSLTFVPSTQDISYSRSTPNTSSFASTPSVPSTLSVLTENTSTSPEQGSPSVLSWNFSISYSTYGPMSEQTTIVTDCVIVNGYYDYETQQTMSSDCNLVIAGITLDHAGYYTCYDDYYYAVKSVSSELTVVYPEPVIRFNTTEVVPGDPLNISCSLEYSGPRALNVCLESTSYTTTFVTNSMDNSYPGFVSTYAVIRVEEPNVPSFSCSGCLSGHTAGPFFATNTPTVPGNLSVAHSVAIRLSYPVNSSSIHIDVLGNSSIYVNQRIRCVSNCYPSPDYYEWHIQSNQQQESSRNSSDGWSELLTIPGYVSCTCTVANTINNVTYKATSSIVVLVNSNVTVRSVTPMFGPIAGGTSVTIEGDWTQQNLTVSSVAFSDNNNQISCTIVDKDPGLIVVLTPSVGEDFVNRTLWLTLGVDSSSNVTYYLLFMNSFTYLWNPEILSFFPTSHIVNGGTQVTVSGNNLTSVAKPQIFVRVEIIRYDAANTSTSSDYEFCQVVNAHEMTCLVPPVNLPPDFQLIDGPNNSSVGISRRRRSIDEPVQTLTGDNGRDKAVIYLGFILDGDTKCSSLRNIQCLPDTTVTFTNKPEINFTKGILKFHPNSEDTISIKGDHMTRGCRLVDYMVKLSNGSCEVDTLHDNQLTCKPPKNAPEKSSDDLNVCDDHLIVIVYVGYAKYLYTCLDYDDLNLPLILGLSIGLGLFGLLLIIIIIAVIAVKCKRKRNKAFAISSAIPDRNSATTTERTSVPDVTEMEYTTDIEMPSSYHDLTTEQEERSQRSPDDSQGYLKLKSDDQDDGYL